MHEQSREPSTILAEIPRSPNDAQNRAIHARDRSAAIPAEGDKLEPMQAFDALYGDLRDLARRQLSSGDTLNTTALVHELYLRMAERKDVRFDDHRAFFGYAARAMRHMLVDRARHRLRRKRGAGAKHLMLDEASAGAVLVQIDEALELDELLTLLVAEDARAAEALELHYFAGLTVERVAEVFGVTRRTVHRDLEFAHAFIKANWQA